jgi:hypothetical protein
LGAADFRQDDSESLGSRRRNVAQGEVFLGEVIEERGTRDAGGSGYFLDGNFFVAMPAEELESNADDFRASVPFAGREGALDLNSFPRSSSKIWTQVKTSIGM